MTPGLDHPDAPMGERASAPMEVTPELYRELRRIAARHLAGDRPDHTLQPTALVHEAYMKLAGARQSEYSGEAHFLAVASRAMRQILVDYARSRATLKRVAGVNKAPSWAAMLEVKDEAGLLFADLVALDDALAALAAENSTLAQLIEMRYFGGMTAEQTAAFLGRSVHVVRHELRFAHAWLRRKLES